jgi:chemotaxis protein histidine kinase CheA
MTDALKPLGLADFFGLEAGEYLERLDALLGRPDAATLGEEFVRLARALRGSALMANQQPIARAAQGLELLARAVREGRRPWDDDTKHLAVRAVDDLKIFVRRAPAWTEADTTKADAMAEQLERLTGRAAAAPRGTEPLALDAGARAFVAREGAAIASSLDRAAQALRQNPLAHDPLQQVLRALQPLRGLAALTDLPPLPDLLEGIERTIGDLSRVTGTPPAAAPDLFQAAAVAIAQAARGVAERGKPDADSTEFKAFAALLVQFMESGPAEREGGVVPIAALYYDDAGPHIVERGTAAERPAKIGHMELVSHGEHLRQAADSVERAPSATQRELRAHALVGTFRALAETGGSPLADAVAAFALAAREAVSAGMAVRHAAAFAGTLRRAGDLLARASTDDEATQVARIAELATAMRDLATGTVPVAPSAPAPVAPLPPTHKAPSPAAPRRPPPGTADAPVPETPDLVGSWVAYHRQVEAGIGPASLQELFAGAAQPAAGLPYLDIGPRIEPSAPTVEPELSVVDIRMLLYRGQGALARARELRDAAKRASGDELRALVDEVCDLVALAIEAGD